LGLLYVSIILGLMPAKSGSPRINVFRGTIGAKPPKGVSMSGHGEKGGVVEREKGSKQDRSKQRKKSRASKRKTVSQEA